MSRESTQFKEGRAANPPGRPKGSGYKQALFQSEIMPRAKEITAKALELAMEGNETIIKMLMERFIPRPQDNPVPFYLDNTINEETLTKASEGVIKLVSVGELLPEEGKAVTDMLKTHKDSLLMQNLMEKLVTLQQKVDSLEKK